MTTAPRSGRRVLSMLALVVGALLAGCRPSMRRLDEAAIHEGPELRLKVVRYYENLPFHFSGEIGVVQCASSATRGIEAGRTNDGGWVPLGRVRALGSGSAGELLPLARADYLVGQDRTLVWKGTVLQVSFDGCSAFATWDPTTLPPERIDPVEKPDYCAPKGTGDCRYYDFHGDRAPRYAEIRVTPGGTIDFRVASRSFTPTQTLRVTSEDSGATWHVSDGE